jgi:hypothetical protein
MAEQHRATPEQWKATEKYAHAAIGCYSDSCILELRDRIAALEEAENDRRFRDCKAAIDNYRQDHLRDAPEMVATDDALMRHYAQAVTDAIQRGATNDELSQAGRRAVYELGRQHGAAQATCPYIISSDEGTSYCQLAEQGNSSAALTGSNHPEKPDSSYAPDGGLVAKVTDAVVYGIEISDQRGAIDAILAVAEWFDAIGYGGTASIVRHELQRHG